MVFAGEPLERPRRIWRNFVARSIQPRKTGPRHALIPCPAKSGCLPRRRPVKTNRAFLAHPAQLFLPALKTA